MFLKNKIEINKLFLYWVLISLFLVLSLIVVGGLTRLTNSGLSIIEWELFKGILPPQDQNSWEMYFEKYKTIPQYKYLNHDMRLEEFKVIFYWEYYHRLLARIIGLFFLIPLIFFYYSKKIKTEYLKTCFLIFGLIILQGIIGWYMVMSGLVNDVTVSHYRLSLHLTIAIIIISSIFWLYKNISNRNNKIFFQFSKKNYPFQFLIFIILLQIIMGAFVSGLDAGLIYQTWPLMGDSFIPNDFTLKNFIDFFNFDNRSLVQFYHRILAYLLILYVTLLTLIIVKNKIIHLYKPLKILIITMTIQVILGITTLISGLNILLAAGHQFIGVLLVFSALNLYYLNAK